MSLSHFVYCSLVAWQHPHTQGGGELNETYEEEEEEEGEGEEEELDDEDDDDEPVS